MSFKGHRRRLWLLLLVALLFVNAISPWPHEISRYIALTVGLGTAFGWGLCGLIVARRVTGWSRRWRLLMSTGLLSLSVGEALWWAHGFREPVPTISLVAYLLCPLFALVAIAGLVRAGGGLTGSDESSARPTPATTVIDGVVACLSFLILVAMGGFGAGSSVSLPRSDNVTVEVLFALAELLVVLSTVLVAMAYQPGRLYRTNLLLLCSGFLLTITSDRAIAYFDSAGAAGATRWGGIGFTVGLTLIGMAMLELPHDQRPSKRSDGFDWVQLILPYISFLGVAVLYAYHFGRGATMHAVILWVTVVMVLLVAVRQVVAIRAQYLLTERLLTTQRRLAHQVHHDSLTGLPNRVLFARRLDEAMRTGRFVLIFVDLDDFKEVNDRYGHAAGDTLLRAVGERLGRCVGEADTLARIGGDEFAILMDGTVDEPEAVAERLRVALREPFAVNGSSVRVRASMGLVRPGEDGVPQSSDDLLRQADVSMYAGKRLGKDTAVVYRPSSGVSVDFPTALRRARGAAPPGFQLVYQPIVRLPHQTPVAVEALARWTTADGIAISPETFVSVAEAAGMGADLDALVLDMACREVSGAGIDLDIHVNVGAARLGNPTFERRIMRTLERYGIEPDRLVLEITETVPIVDLTDAADQIARLNALGIKVALDDFGAGYNSLTYLHVLPVQIVKLDRSLVAGAARARDVALYRSVIRLCDALGLAVVAEGIEMAAQADTVYDAGCDLAQGHLFAKPVPIGAVLPSVPSGPS
ncbi:bifunctional diguanylate cyclase/phosphodiesterase [Mycobacterium sp. AMU20-3851]|uniref:putative bifunctional diguanylate cyclase/phosphodiesterase n=1 Tax=Mycobacterium sp. AMU20-3851 TaxID=3122055 RepID=UPI003754D569